MDANDKSGRDHMVIDVAKKCKKCIFRVPRVLRRQKKEAYTPDVVSIGPFHYPGERGKCKGHFQLMKQVKNRYLKEILTGMNITLEELTAKVSELSDEKNEGRFEERARGFYAEPHSLVHITSEAFIKMMILDGCFLIQLFRKCNDPKLRDFDDPVFNMDCMFHFLCHDILLLENQLPWFVIHILYGLTLHIYPDEQPPLSIIILQAFTILPSLKRTCSSYGNKIKCHCDADYLHILDLVRASIVNSSKTKDKSDNEAVHEAVFDPDQHQMHTATALSKADIKFENAIKESIMDIKFEESHCN
ncbi:hypothetical protein M0R45_018171 [Rubus argutus]|uniref:Uncharacterized protein n=1 Tax=Rubus argutus TaxID=59490 RepID=A0AAW1X2Z6_RUBAR